MNNNNKINNSNITVDEGIYVDNLLMNQVINNTIFNFSFPLQNSTARES